MLLQNTVKKLITINAAPRKEKDDEGGLRHVAFDKKYLIKPAGEPVEVPDELCAGKFVKALIDNKSLAVIKEDHNAGPDDGDDGDDGDEDALGISKMSKAELIKFAKEELEIDLDSEKGVKILRAELNEKINSEG